MLNKLIRSGAVFVALALCAVVPAVGAGGQTIPPGEVSGGCRLIDEVEVSQAPTSGDVRLVVAVREGPETGTQPYLDPRAEQDGDYFTDPSTSTTGCTTTAPTLGQYIEPPPLVTYEAVVRSYLPNGNLGEVLGTASTQQLTQPDVAGAPYTAEITVDVEPGDFCVQVTSGPQHDVSPEDGSWGCYRTGLKGKRGGGTFPYLI